MFGYQPKKQLTDDPTLLEQLSDTPLNVLNYPGYAAGATEFAGNALSNIAGSMSPVRFEDADGPSGQAGFYPQVPPMITETADAWGRLFGPQDNWHDGPGEVYPGDQNADAATTALAFYGGNALSAARPKQAAASAATSMRPFKYNVISGLHDIFAMGHVTDGKAFIENIESPSGPNAIGVAGLKALRERFREDFPDVTTFEGFRSSGAKAQNGLWGDDLKQSVELLSDNKPSILGSAVAGAGDNQAGGLPDAPRPPSYAGLLAEATRRHFRLAAQKGDMSPVRLGALSATVPGFVGGAHMMGLPADLMPASVAGSVLGLLHPHAVDIKNIYNHMKRTTPPDRLFSDNKPSILGGSTAPQYDPELEEILRRYEQ